MNNENEKINENEINNIMNMVKIMRNMKKWK